MTIKRLPLFTSIGVIPSVHRYEFSLGTAVFDFDLNHCEALFFELAGLTTIGNQSQTPNREFFDAKISR
jgi:hypothetical protein